jgi:hypothetical protein
MSLSIIGRASALACLCCIFVIPALADQSAGSTPVAQPPVNDFAGMIISGVDGKRVGIGTREPAATLDVYQGEVKIGSTGAPCTKALAGAIRYSDAGLQLCDGAGWRNVSLDKAQ